MSDMIGNPTLNDLGWDLFDKIVASLLPESVEWCGDDLIAPVDFDGEVDVHAILEAAVEKIWSIDEVEGELIWVEEVNA